MIHVLPAKIVHHHQPGVAHVVERRLPRMPDDRVGQVHRAGACFGIAPVVGHFGRTVAQGGRGDDDAVGGLQHGGRQRNGRVHPVRVQPHVHFPVPRLLDREPLDELLVCLVDEAAQHLHEPGQCQFRAPGQRTRQRLDARPLGAVELRRLIVQPLHQPLCKRRHRPLQIYEGSRQRTGSRPQAVHERAAIGFKRHALIILGPRNHLLAHERQKRLGFTLRLASLDAPHPSRSGQAESTLQHLVQQGFSLIVITGQISQPVDQPAPAPPLRLRAADPAPELGRFLSGQMAGEGRVGGIEQVMAFVEHQPA